MRIGKMLLLGAGLLTLSWSTLGCGSSNSSDAVTASIAGTNDEPAAPVEEKAPQVQIHTSMGDITLELDAKSAPLTVENFLAYVSRGHYDKTLFHQVEAGFMLLGGGYGLDMQEKPTDAPIRNEAHNGLKNLRGTIAMAREFDVVDGARAQFFINLVDNPSLDHHDRTLEDYGYCVFGKVISGLEVVDRIGEVQVRDSDQFVKLPASQLVIESIRRLR